MNNIILLRGRTAVSKFPVTRTQPAASRLDRAPVAQRPALIAVWHTNPFSGKLECLWTTEDRAIRDEDGSRGAGGRRAA
ncbi:hypothetical protein ACFYE9_18940 [Rhizobium leguminosarum]|uniref:Uncharacterized protein n=2 Tax=Rhizobium leguminosarum TaxID=384 RepID=A0A154IAX2_RHILE|nr:hypothetical protein [Rhizobium leguminosarum]KZA97744.1 hypothetical protein A4A59_29900 [Rhizobium leguminosarum]